MEEESFISSFKNRAIRKKEKKIDELKLDIEIAKLEKQLEEIKREKS